MTHHLKRNDYRVRIAERTAPLMFWTSLAFLVCQAIMVVVLVDVPNLRESVTGEIHDEPVAGISENHIEHIALLVIYLVWPMVVAESTFHWITRPWNRETHWFHFYSLLVCGCPSLRMCARSMEMGKRLWLPGWGWRQPDARLRRRLERRFSLPMIWIALLILPVLVVELWLKNQVAEYRGLRIALHVGTGVIWFSFAAEFILMVSVAEKKLTYIKQHWIDLAIILLPLLSFMRSLRLLRITGMSQLIRVSQFNQVVRTYRLRGTAMRALRALILLDLFQRLALRSPEKTIAKLELQLQELEAESKQIRRKINRMQKVLRERDQTPVIAMQPEDLKSQSIPKN